MRLKQAFILILSLLCLPALGEEEEFSFADITIRPTVSILAPAANSTYESGGKLTVTASAQNAQSITVTLEWAGGSLTQSAQGGELNTVFDVGPLTVPATITATAKGEEDEYGYPTEATATLAVLSPKEKLISDMFGEAYRNSKNKTYKFARAQDDGDIGVCKNFVMRLFDTYKSAYAMLEYPELALYMPKNNSKKNCAPYDYGIEWRLEGPSDGAPFEIAAQFKYDNALSKEENQALCRQVLESVKRGDFFQMVGYYYYGNGPHSLLFMSDYSPLDDTLRWTDSNMKGENVDGARWGYLQYDASRTAQWFVEAICMKNRGCTLYRLRDDLYVK